MTARRELLPHPLTPTFTPAQQSGLIGLLRCGGAMVIEIIGNSELDVGAACAVACLAQCIKPGWVTHEMVGESSGLYSLTRLGRAAAKFLDSMGCR